MDAGPQNFVRTNSLRVLKSLDKLLDAVWFDVLCHLAHEVIDQEDIVIGKAIQRMTMNEPTYINS